MNDVSNSASIPVWAHSTKVRNIVIHSSDLELALRDCAAEAAICRKATSLAANVKAFSCTLLGWGPSLLLAYMTSDFKDTFGVLARKWNDLFLVVGSAISVLGISLLVASLVWLSRIKSQSAEDIARKYAKRVVDEHHSARVLTERVDASVEWNSVTSFTARQPEK